MAPPPGSFAFPPFHAFPPAYTVQPTAATRARQVELWVACILDYCRHHRLFWLGPEGHGQLFRNDAVEYVGLGSGEGVVDDWLTDGRPSVWAEDDCVAKVDWQSQNED